MFSSDLVAFLQSGCSLITAVVGSDGHPLASRAWGCTVEDPEAGRIRLLVGADDHEDRGAPAVGCPIAFTGADVATLRSAQVKGVVTAIDPPRDNDLTAHARFCDELFGAILAVDDVPPELTSRLVPDRLVACSIEAHEIFDQTPGPAAGTPIAPPDR